MPWPVKYHLIRLATLSGAVCLGPDRGRESQLVLVRDWIGEQSPVGDRENGLAELARRYIAAFAPATERDFAHWSGLSLTDCRRGLTRIAAELDEVRIGDDVALVLRSGRARSPRRPLVRLLGGFDTYLMGYASRDHAVTPENGRRILPGGGILRPTVCVDGRFVGTWSSKRSGSRLEISIEPFDELDPSWSEAIAAEIDDIDRFEAAR